MPLKPSQVRWLYRTLDRIVDADEGWWPFQHRDEIAIGAILTQNTNWKNVEKALENLRKEGLNSFHSIANSRIDKLKELIKPAGFFNQKASYLKELAKFMERLKLGGAFKDLMNDREKLRKELLEVRGIGKETADSILLYYFDIPSFVIDAYTKRIVKRIFGIDEDYESLKRDFERAFPPIPKNLPIYKKFHAMIVEFAKEICRKKPLCKKCPIRRCLYRNQISTLS